MSAPVPPYRVLTGGQNTREWLRLRKLGVGASESAAILGDSAWGTARSVYEQKASDEVEDVTTDLMELGHLAEPLIVAFLKLHPERFGWIGEITESPGLLQSVEWPWLLGSLDRQVLTPTGEVVPLELKSVNDFVAADWKGAEGEPGYKVPQKYQVQVQQQMAVTGAPFAYVAAWLGKDAVVVVRVDRDDDYIQEHLVGRIGDFWAFNVQASTPPPLTMNDDLWKYLPGDPELEPVTADEELYDLIGQWRVATTDQRQLRDDIENMKFGIATRMGNATSALHPETGKPIHTLKGQRTARTVDLAVLEAKYPDAYAECVSEPGWTRVHRATKEEV